MYRSMLAALACLAFAPLPARAQILDPDDCWTCRDSWYHFGAGAAVDLAVRGGYVAKSWRNNIAGRIALVALVGAAYEGVETFSAWENGTLGQRGYGFGLKDLAMDVGGAIAVEALVFVVNRVVHRRPQAP